MPQQQIWFYGFPGSAQAVIDEALGLRRLRGILLLRHSSAFQLTHRWWEKHQTHVLDPCRVICSRWTHLSWRPGQISQPHQLAPFIAHGQQFQHELSPNLSTVCPKLNQRSSLPCFLPGFSSFYFYVTSEGFMCTNFYHIHHSEKLIKTFSWWVKFW